MALFWPPHTAGTYIQGVHTLTQANTLTHVCWFVPIIPALRTATDIEASLGYNDRSYISKPKNKQVEALGKPYVMKKQKMAVFREKGCVWK